MTLRPFTFRVFGAMSCWQVIGMTRKQRAALGPIREVCVDVIGAEGIIVEQLAQVLHNHAGIDELIVSEHGILDGIARSVAG